MSETLDPAGSHVEEAEDYIVTYLRCNDQRGQ